MAHKEGEWWSDAKRAEVVASYLILAKAPLVEAVTGVPAGTIRQWKTQPWWKELVEQIQTEDSQELDTKLSTRINKVLEVVQDRLDKGDFFYDSYAKEFIRKPVSLKDTWKTGKEMIDVRQMIRKEKPEQVNQEAVADILKNLAKEFASMAKKKVAEKVENLTPNTDIK